MRKPLVFLFVFIFAFAAFIGTALAEPSAMSFFSNQEYNKVFADDQGITHTVKATQVSEIWNKAGSVLFIIQTKETYTDLEGNDHIEVRDDTKIYTDACPKYPDSTHQTVYRVEWYPDGHSQVKYDYRPVSTPTPAATQSPTARPTAQPTPKPTASPMTKATAKPTVSSTASPTAAATPTATTSDATAVYAATTTPSPSYSPMPSASPSPMTVVASAASGSPKAIEAVLPVTEPVQSDDSTWLWGVAVVIFVGLSVFLFVLISCRRRKEKRENGPNEA